MQQTIVKIKIVTLSVHAQLQFNIQWMGFCVFRLKDRTGYYGVQNPI